MVQLRERLTALETEVPHVSKTANAASKAAHEAKNEVRLLQLSLDTLGMELKQLRVMLNRYMQIGGMLSIAIVLKITTGDSGSLLTSALRALSYALRHAS